MFDLAETQEEIVAGAKIKVIESLKYCGIPPVEMPATYWARLAHKPANVPIKVIFKNNGGNWDWDEIKYGDYKPKPDPQESIKGTSRAEYMESIKNLDHNIPRNPKLWNLPDPQPIQDALRFAKRGVSGSSLLTSMDWSLLKSDDNEPKPPASPLDEQVGGSHYKNFAIQPIEFILKNRLDFTQGNVIKYICRFREKNGRQDLEKLIHYIRMLIEIEYPEK